MRQITDLTSTDTSTDQSLNSSGFIEVTVTAVCNAINKVSNKESVSINNTY